MSSGLLRKGRRKMLQILLESDDFVEFMVALIIAIVCGLVVLLLNWLSIWIMPFLVGVAIFYLVQGS